MTIIAFPPVETADEHGLLAIGGDLEVESLLLAYSSGIFPWPVDEEHLTWFAPPKRAVLYLDNFHISRSLSKAQKHSKFHFAIDKDFEAVICSCAELTNRKKQNGTWITDDMIAGYLAFHQAGYAHSIECYDENELVGGLYGVAIGAMFAAESMFYRKANASKLALVFLVEHLKAYNVPWIDCQNLTPFLETFGVVEIERKQFMQMLQVALMQDCEWFS